MIGLFCWLMLWTMLKRRGLGTDARALTLIAVVSSLFTALLEIGWIWAYQGYAVSEILSIYFTFDLGTPPALKNPRARPADRSRSARPAIAVRKSVRPQGPESLIGLRCDVRQPAPLMRAQIAPREAAFVIRNMTSMSKPPEQEGPQIPALDMPWDVRHGRLQHVLGNCQE
jgi:hypothetical protein